MSERKSGLCGGLLCPKCGREMLATGGFYDCNTWTCPECHNVEPELVSLRINECIETVKIGETK